MSSRRYALRTFVHRVLALRLLAAGAGVAVVFGTIAYARGYERISDVVLPVWTWLMGTLRFIGKI